MKRNILFNLAVKVVGNIEQKGVFKIFVIILAIFIYLLRLVLSYNFV